MITRTRKKAANVLLVVLCSIYSLQLMPAAEADMTVLKGGVNKDIVVFTVPPSATSTTVTVSVGPSGAFPVSTGTYSANTVPLATTASLATTPRFVSQQGRYDSRVVRSSARPAQVIRSVERPRTTVRVVEDRRTFFQRHPKVRATLIGAGVGTAAGAVTGLISRRGVLRGAAIGAGSGAGIGLIRSSDTLKRHPIIRDVATGTVAGLGLGWAASRKGKRIAQGAGVGAAVGLGLGLLRDGLR